MPKQFAVSPAQRFLLVDLAHDKDHRVPNGQEGRRFRRALRQVGALHITELARKNTGVNSKASRDEVTKHRVELEEESIDVLLKIMSERARTTVAELVLGPFYDDLEDAKAGRAYALPSPEEAPPLDVEQDRARWEPEAEDEDTSVDHPVVNGADTTKTGEVAVDPSKSAQPSAH